MTVAGVAVPSASVVSSSLSTASPPVECPISTVLLSTFRTSVMYGNQNCSRDSKGSESSSSQRVIWHVLLSSRSSQCSLSPHAAVCCHHTLLAAVTTRCCVCHQTLLSSPHAALLSPHAAVVTTRCCAVTTRCCAVTWHCGLWQQHLHPTGRELLGDPRVPAALPHWALASSMHNLLSLWK